MKKIVFNEFYDKFKIGEVIKRNDLKIFLEKYYGELKNSTLTWRIYDLKNKGYITLKEKNLFIVVDRTKYKEFIVDVNIELINNVKKYNTNMNKLKKMYRDEQNINICVWNTKLLNNYTIHQTFKNYTIIEVAKERVESLFYFLKPNINNLFILRKTNGIDYLLDNDSVIIDNLPLKSPLQKKMSFSENFVSYPKAEKVLVDVFVYNKTILPYDISEIMSIYKNIYKNHIIKTKTVLNYARIRGPKIKESVYNMLKKIGELEND